VSSATTSRLTGRAAAAHLLGRATFGVAPGDIDELLQHGQRRFLDRQLTVSPEHESLAAKLRKIPAIQYTTSEYVLRHALDNMSVASVGCPLEDLRTAKLMRAVESHNQLHEVMTDFWFNHFNVYVYAWPPSVPEYERESIRPHALGRFRDLLGAVAKAPAMTYYLDTYISTADRMEKGKLVRGLNENFGRELLELHTVGVNAGYTQHDVAEASRCFTGWDFGTWWATVYGFRFAHESHDIGPKKVFGLDIAAGGGQSDGERLLDYLDAHPATAHFISWRLVQRFVADDPPERLVKRCAAVFKKTDGSIVDVLRTIFTSDEFWSPAAFRSKVKSPLEYVSGTIRAVGGALSDGLQAGNALASLGMPAYECKPPTGYSNRSTDWINVSGQLHRFNFAIGVASGTLRGVDVSAPAGDSESIARAFANDILAVPLRETTLRAVTSVESPSKATALLLASPEFQMR
jgi:uncharacterized protein (DUF1800 family)